MEDGAVTWFLAGRPANSDGGGGDRVGDGEGDQKASRSTPCIASSAWASTLGCGANRRGVRGSGGARSGIGGDEGGTNSSTSVMSPSASSMSKSSMSGGGLAGTKRERRDGPATGCSTWRAMGDCLDGAGGSEEGWCERMSRSVVADMGDGYDPSVRLR